MPVRDMYKSIQELRTEFRDALYDGAGDYLPIIRKGLDMFGGEFEEQTLAENLREEFNDFLEAAMLVEKEA